MPWFAWIGILAALGYALDQADDAADSGARLVQWLIVLSALYAAWQLASSRR
jgi:hypothetical protein